MVTKTQEDLVDPSADLDSNKINAKLQIPAEEPGIHISDDFNRKVEFTDSRSDNGDYEEPVKEISPE